MVARPDILKRPFWSLIAVLTWIATRDLTLVADAEQKPRKPMWLDLTLGEISEPEYETATDVWERELAPKLSNGKLHGLGTRIVLNAFNSREHHEVGFRFPPDDQPGAATRYRLDEDKPSAICIGIRGYALRNNFEDMVFDRETVMAIWEPPQPEPEQGTEAWAEKHLRDLITKSPNARTITKEEFHKVSKLTGRAAYYIWSQETRKAPAWQKPGAPRKKPS